MALIFLFALSAPSFALTVSSIGGNSQSGSREGIQAYSSINAPRGLAQDQEGNVYTTDYENHIIKISPEGYLNYLAGSGEGDYQDGTGLKAKFNQPQALVYFQNQLFIADTYNHCIRKINLHNKLVTTIAGLPGVPGYQDGTLGIAKFNMPSGIAVDQDGNLYVADSLNRRIRKININGEVSTIAGSGENGFFDGPATMAKFRKPIGIAVDSKKEIFISDRDNCRIRKLYLRDGKPVIETVAGTGMVGDKSGFAILAELNMPENIAFDSADNLYVSDTGNNKIKKLNLQKSELVEVSGKKDSGYADGLAIQASFHAPSGILVNEKKEVLIADTKNNVIRKISLLEQQNSFEVKTIAGNNQVGSRDGKLGIGSLNHPSAIAKDSLGNIYIADKKNHLIRKLDKSGTMSTFAGSSQGCQDGTGTLAKFSFPEDIVIDREDNLYVADYGNHRIRKITKTGLVSTFAGNGLAGKNDGQLTSASFYFPKALAIDANDNLVVADTGNNAIRLIIKRSSHVFTLAGTGQKGFIDGLALEASFNEPNDIALNSRGEIFVADTENNAIRKITNNAGTWSVSTLSGFFGPGKDDGELSSALFNHPVSLDFDNENNLYISDSLNYKIRKIDFKKSQVETFSGIGLPGFLDAQRNESAYNEQEKILITDNHLLIADSKNNRIRQVELSNQVCEIVTDIKQNKKPTIKLVNSLEFDEKNFFRLQQGTPLELKVFVYDLEDEYSQISETQWISNLQGNLTTGLKFNTKNLEAGKHNITVTAKDSRGAEKTLKFNLEVVSGQQTISQTN